MADLFAFLALERYFSHSIGCNYWKLNVNKINSKTLEQAYSLLLGLLLLWYLAAKLRMMSE